MKFRLLQFDYDEHRFHIALWWSVGNVTKVRFWRPKNFKLIHPDLTEHNNG